MYYQSPLFLPKSDWKAPSHYPDLSAAREICVDVETFDPNLLTKGPGGVREDGFVCGVAVAVEGWKGYYPICHSEENLPREAVLSWLQDQLKDPNQDKVAATGIYDREWLEATGIKPQGIWRDIQIAEPLLDEELPTYRLDDLALQYLGVGKDEELMIEAEQAYGIARSKSAMHLLPSRYVGLYAEGDVEKTLAIYQKQKDKLKLENLEQIFNLESRLTEVVLKMRQKGVRLDLEKVHSLIQKYAREEEILYGELKSKFFPSTNPSFMSAHDLERICTAKGWHFDRTAQGNPSFTSAFFEEQAEDGNEFFRGVGRWRKINKLRTTFLQEAILGKVHKDRLHAEFIQMKKDEGGTRSGRFACKSPNLQQIPSREEDLAADIRSCFLPEEGEEWCDFDYSSQEPRMTVHYAALMNLPKAADIQAEYIANPRTDYHGVVAKMAGISRREAKTINLGLAYGMGKAKLALQLGRTMEEIEPLFQLYHEQVPYVQLLSKNVSGRASQRGWIRTIGGRVLHFNYWEPNERGLNQVIPERLERAQGKWPNRPLRRAGTHKALNRLIQGSSADQTKMAMLNLYEQVGLIPMMQIHDSLSYSLASTALQDKVEEGMVGAVKLGVPTVVDRKVGKNWACK